MMALFPTFCNPILSFFPIGADTWSSPRRSKGESLVYTQIWNVVSTSVSNDV
jgi:hypothetical protein